MTRRIQRIIAECDSIAADYDMCCTLSGYLEEIRDYAELFLSEANECECCGRLIADEHVHIGYDNGYYCSCCVSDVNASASPIGYYHENKGTYQFLTIGEDSPKNYRGLEIEIECEVNPEILDILERYTDIFVYEEDGSLSEGFEAITQPMSQNYWSAVGYDRIYRFIRDLKGTSENIRAWNGNCGLHIHFNRCEWSDEAQEFLKDFVVQNHELLRKLCGRDDYDYCRLPSQSDYYRDDYGNLYNSSRYLALNFTRNTIEFRIWRGTLKEEFIWASTELSEALLEFSEFAVSTGREYNILPCEEDFVNYCSENYPELTFFKNSRRRRFNRHYRSNTKDNWG